MTCSLVLVFSFLFLPNCFLIYFTTLLTLEDRDPLDPRAKATVENSSCLFKVTITSTLGYINSGEKPSEMEEEPSCCSSHWGCVLCSTRAIALCSFPYPVLFLGDLLLSYHPLFIIYAQSISEVILSLELNSCWK